MAEVQNVGALDYNQFQPTQLQTVPEDDVANMPAVYDEAIEEKKSAGMGMVGATILGATMLVVGGLIGKKMGSKGVEAAEKAAEEAKQKAEEAKQKAEEAVKNYEKIQEANSEIEKAIKENNDKGVLGRFMGFQKMKDKIMELIKPFKKEAKAVEEKAAEKTEETAKKD